MKKVISQITIKQILYSFLGMTLLAIALGGISAVDRGLDAIGAAGWVIPDKLTGDKLARGLGTSVFMTLIALSQVIIQKISKNKVDVYSFVMQVLYAWLIGLFINFFVGAFLYGFGPFDYYVVRNMFEEGTPLGEIWLGVQYTIWLMILLIGAAFILRAHLFLSAAEKLMSVLNEIYKVSMAKARMIFDASLIVFVVIYTTLLSIPLTNYLSYGTVIALVLTGPLFAFFYKKLTWVKP